MGAKLHPSPRLYRVYAPSTHSLPVIKCVAGTDGVAEIEVKSCHSGLYRLKDLSPLYQRIWNSKKTKADKSTMKGSSRHARRTFSVVWIFLLFSRNMSNFLDVYISRRLFEAAFAAATHGQALEFRNTGTFSTEWTTQSIGMRPQRHWEVDIQPVSFESSPQPSAANRYRA